MPRPRGKRAGKLLKPEQVAGLLKGEQLARLPGTGIQFPIRLTAHSSYVSGRATLIFISPHVLSPADDVAEFGFANPDGLAVYEGDIPYYPPHEGAFLVAWFRPPEVNRKYNIEFFCTGSFRGLWDIQGSFTLESSDGNTETVKVTQDADYPESASPPTTADEHVSTTFMADDNAWRWFTLYCPTYWRFWYCELSLLP